MPIHDWTRVTAGTFHAFHLAWIAEMQRVLNSRVLPSGYYALAEQVANQVVPDVLTLQDLGEAGSDEPDGTASGGDAEGNGAAGLAVATAPPRVTILDTVTEAMLLAARRRRIVIRHTTGDSVVALVEFVCPGNKEKRGAVRDFVDTMMGALEEAYYLLVIDLFPPRMFDPRGLHGVAWERLGGSYEPPDGKPLTLASYVAAGAVTCYVEPTAVGAELIDMPLFLDAGHYVNVPLEPTYLAAYEGVPQRWRRVIEGRSVN
jgi:hypothetical protein